MSIVTTDNRFYSEIAAAIREKNGESTLYLPADMAEAILAIKGGGEAFALLVVNYPANADITCTNSIGSKAITDTRIMFYVEAPESGTEQSCIVSISDATHDPIFKTVDGIAEGQGIETSIGFEYYLFKSGEGEVISWKSVGGGTLTKSTESLVCGKYSICTVDKVDFSEYSTLCIDILPTNMSAGGYGYKFGVTIAPNNTSAANFYHGTVGRVPDGAIQNNQYAIGTAPIVNNTRATVEIPITDGAKGEYYLGFGAYAGNYTIYNVYLK